MPYTRQRPATAFAFAITGGVVVLLSGILIAMVGFVVTSPIGGIGVAYGLVGILWGIFMLVASMMMFEFPDQHAIWGTALIVFSFGSWFGAIGGFFLGFILGLVGGIMAIIWKPEVNLDIR